uniref:Uncharacterized protein n=1 Tax=Eutreptiella gymnastica TaxID=73025 RepID=A0A7S1J5K4_9EUGL
MQIACLSDGLSIPVCAGTEVVLRTHPLGVLCAFFVLVVLQDGHAHLLWQWLHRPHEIPSVTTLLCPPVHVPFWSLFLDLVEAFPAEPGVDAPVGSTRCGLGA